MGILPGSQLEPEEAPKLGGGFPLPDVGGGSPCPGGTGGSSVSSLSFGVGAGSWIWGHALRMFINFW